jgi:actin-related protein 8
MQLHMGGHDVTEFLFVLLQRIGFPYRSADLARTYDWQVLEDLKQRICTLAEVRAPHPRPRRARADARAQTDVALNLYTFAVRRPGARTEKYQLRAYDEPILAPMVRRAPPHHIPTYLT